MPITLTESTELHLLAADHQRGDYPIPLDDPYVDRYWTSVVGPAVIALARFVAVEHGHRWTVDDLARAVGFGRSIRRFESTMRRGLDTRFLYRHDIAVVAWQHVAPLSRVNVDRLPAKLRGELRFGTTAARQAVAR